jgi:Gpi18-like mannosyltransferase
VADPNKEPGGNTRERFFDDPRLIPTGRFQFLRGVFSQVAFICASATVVKLALFPVSNPDLTCFLLPWLQHIEARGLPALSDEFTDYGPGYTYILLLASALTAWMPPISSVKLLSVLADCVMAVCGGVVVARASNNIIRGALTAAALVALPSVVLNSGAWGQSDSIWTAAVLACVLAMSRQEPAVAILWFGLALAFKPQAVFLAPMLLGFLISSGAWPILSLAVLPYTLLALPMLFAGREARSVFFVYASAAVSPSEPPSSNAASLWAWFPDSVAPAFILAGVAIAALVGAGLTLAAYRRNERLRGGRLVIGAALCCTLMPFLLPKMHDRYFYAGEVLSAISVCLRPSLLPALVASQTAALLAYQPFLLGFTAWRVPVAAVFNLLTCVMLTASWISRAPGAGSRIGARIGV